MRVMLLEDNGPVRDMLAKLLARQGHEVTAYPEPKDCDYFLYEKCKCSEQGFCTDVLITDYDMPGLTGLAFLEHRWNQGCHLPPARVAFFTAEMPEEAMKVAANLGCCVFRKPTGLLHLIEWANKLDHQLTTKQRLFG